MYIRLSVAIMIEEIEPLVHSCPLFYLQGRHAHDLFPLASRVVEGDEQVDCPVIQTGQHGHGPSNQAPVSLSPKRPQGIRPVKRKTVPKFQILRHARTLCRVLWAKQVRRQAERVHARLAHGLVKLGQDVHVPPLSRFMQRRTTVHARMSPKRLRQVSTLHDLDVQRAYCCP